MSKIGVANKMDDLELTELKKNINDLIWHYSPKNFTLEDGEVLASSILLAIVEGRKPFINPKK